MFNPGRANLSDVVFFLIYCFSLRKSGAIKEIRNKRFLSFVGIEWFVLQLGPLGIIVISNAISKSIFEKLFIFFSTFQVSSSSVGKSSKQTTPEKSLISTEYIAKICIY